MNAVVVEPSKALSTVTPMEMISLAIEKGAGIDQLEKLMALQERWQANQARMAFDAAISTAKAQIKPITKKRAVDFTTTKGRTNYSYEDLALIAAEIDPILAPLGLSYRYRSKQDGASVSVTCVIAHRDGHSEETTLTAAKDDTGNKNSIQAVGSTVTYLQRYTLKLALGLAATKDDDGRQTDGPQSPEGLEDWKADMRAVAEKGTKRLQEAWKAAPGEFKTYVLKNEAHWWNSMKQEAQRHG